MRADAGKASFWSGVSFNRLGAMMGMGLTNPEQYKDSYKRAKKMKGPAFLESNWVLGVELTIIKNALS